MEPITDEHMSNSEGQYQAAILHQLREIRTSQHDISERLVRLEVRTEEFSRLREKVEDLDRYIQQQQGGTRTLYWIASIAGAVASFVSQWVVDRFSHAP
jgi:hypothetical protein